MSAQCPHNVREMLCGHSADIYLQGYMSAQCPHYILLRFSALNIDLCTWDGRGVDIEKETIFFANYSDGAQLRTIVAERKRLSMYLQGMPFIGKV